MLHLKYLQDKTWFLSQHTSFVTAGLRLGNRYLNEERSSHQGALWSTWNSHLAQWISQGWNQLTLGSVPPSGDDEDKYRPSLSIQDRSQYRNMHGNPLQWAGSVWDCTNRGSPWHTGVSECGTSAALHCTPLPQSASGTISLANVPPGPGGGGSKGGCWGGVLGKPYPNYRKRNICLPNHIWNIHFCFNALARGKKKEKRKEKKSDSCNFNLQLLK